MRFKRSFVKTVLKPKTTNQAQHPLFGKTFKVPEISEEALAIARKYAPKNKVYSLNYDNDTFE